MRRAIAVFVSLMVFATIVPSLRAQFGDDKKPAAKPNGVKLDKQKTQRWKCGVIVNATGGGCAGLFGTIAVPTDWPEQTVKIVEEEITPNVQRVAYRVLDNGVKQMLISIPRMSGGERATALVTFEVTRSTVTAPDETSGLKIPDKLPLALSKFLGPSPMIESRHPQITKLAKEIMADKDKATDWEKVEAIYDWVREHVEYQNGKLKGAIAALRDKTGDCEEMTSLFIALCRANKIPARTVWIPDHCYPEFYLVNAKGEGNWYPCQAAGTRDFGGMPEFRPVLQKGDNFKVPEKKEPQRYVAEFLTGTPTPGGGQPNVEFVRQLLQAN